MALRQIAAIRIAKLEDRKTVASILHENGYDIKILSEFSPN